MAQGRTRELSEVQQANISKIQSRKNARRKARKARNMRLREEGVKFSKKDSCYLKRTVV